MNDSPLRVLIVDDHPIVREGMRALLESRPGLEVAGEAADGGEAIAEALRLRPDVIVMDLEMPRVGGIEAIAKIAAEWPEARILVLTTFAAEGYVFPAIKAGARGYLLKDSGPEALVEAIRGVARGEVFISPAIAYKIIQEFESASPGSPPHGSLTDRELQVLQQLGRGLSNQEIADELSLSLRTVGNHVTAILQKLHLKSRTQAALYAVRKGLAGGGR